MPSIIHRSWVRAVSDHYSLSLGVRHHLVAGNSSSPSFNFKKGRFPDDVDVLLASNFVITLSGSFNGEVVSPEALNASALAAHITEYFRMNADELGLISVSLNTDSGLPKVILTSSRQACARRETASAHLSLAAIDLCYSWKAIGASRTDSKGATYPFAPILSLPFKTLMDDVVDRFMTFQLVKRYPLIFGSWRQQFDRESEYFPGIADSILRVICRSPNAVFRDRCRHLVKTLRSRHLDILALASDSLSCYLSSLQSDCSSEMENHVPTGSDQDMLCFALEQIYRDGSSRRQFKGLAVKCIDYADDEDLSQEHSTTLENNAPYGLFWDDCFVDDFSHPTCLLDLPSSDENEGSFDTQDNQHGKHLMGQTQFDDFLNTYKNPSHAELRIDCDSDCVDISGNIMPVLNFDDEGRSYPHAHTYLELDALDTNLNLFHSHGHITLDDLNDYSQGLPELRPSSQDTSCLPSISELPLTQDIELVEEQESRRRRKPDLWKDMLEGPLVSKTGTKTRNLSSDNCNDLDLNILLDIDCSKPASVETFDYDVVPSDGVSVGIVPKPYFQETPRSHHLPVTCSSMADYDHHLRNEEDSDEALWRGENIGIPMRGTNFGDDGLFVIDFNAD